jgi:hypothetical protein
VGLIWELRGVPEHVRADVEDATVAPLPETADMA